MGTLVMAGASHRSASLAVLERLAVRDHNREALFAALRAEGCTEAVILATCSRTEVYAIVEDGGAGHVLDALAQVAGLDREAFGLIAATLDEDDAVNHLFRVASGLDSRILGEVDIQDQVRAARVQAASAAMVGAELQRLFVSAVGVARRVHDETVLGRRGRSLGRRAVEIAMAPFEDEEPVVAIVGSGRMATVAVERLTELGARPAIYARSWARGVRLVRDETRVFGLDALPEALVSADVLLCSTSAAEHLISAQDAREAMHLRDGRPLTVVDLSVPRNVEGSVGSVMGVRLIDLEGIDEDPADRDMLRAAVVLGEAIVAEETARFSAAQRSRRAAPVILALRGRVERVCFEELQRATRGGQAFRPEDLQRAANAIAGKLLHAPIVAAREAAASDDAATIAQLCRLFRVEATPAGGPGETRETPSAVGAGGGRSRLSVAGSIEGSPDA